MKRENLMFSIVALSSVLVLGGACLSSSLINSKASRLDATHQHIGNHYKASDEYSEFWTCCSCHETFLKEVEGSWTDSDASKMSGDIPDIARLNKNLLNLPSSLDGLSNFEKVKNANILYTIKGKIESLSDGEKEKLAGLFDSIKSEYDLFITPLYGVSGEIPAIYDDSVDRIDSITRTENETFGNMFDIKTKSDIGATIFDARLTGIDGQSFAEYTYLSMIAINGYYNWGKDNENANKFVIQNAWTDLDGETYLPGAALESSQGYGKGTGILVSDVSKATKKTFDWPIVRFWETWGHDTGLDHWYFTPLFGIKTPDLSSKATEVDNKISALVEKASSLENEESLSQLALEAYQTRTEYDALSTAIKNKVTKLEDLISVEKTVEQYAKVVEIKSISLTKAYWNETDGTVSNAYDGGVITSAIDENYGNLFTIKPSEKIADPYQRIDLNFLLDSNESYSGYDKAGMFIETSASTGQNASLAGGDPWFGIPYPLKETGLNYYSGSGLNTSSQYLSGLSISNAIPAWGSGESYFLMRVSNIVLLKSNITFTSAY